MKYFPHLNDIFITERLKLHLNKMSNHPITTVIAPMGFGKTTAMNWWSKRKRKSHAEGVYLRQMIATDSVTDFWNGFCNAFKGFPVLVEQMKALGYPNDAQAIAMFSELFTDALSTNTFPVYFILDDLHILSQKALTPLLLFLSQSLPDYVHIILLSRNQIFSEEERMRLGHLLGEITVDDLSLSRPEMAIYAKHCELEVSAEDIHSLATLSEGWISMVYLNFKAYAQYGSWLSSSTDILTLIDQVMLAPLTEREREFLVLIGITDEFTSEQAVYLWQHTDAEKMMKVLSHNNAFITKNEYDIYRYHYMLRQCTRRRFAEKSAAYQQDSYSRLGSWHYHREEFVPAYFAFAKAEDWNALMMTLKKDKVKSLNTEHSQEFFRWLANCPEETLIKHPSALTSCMLKCFSFHNIPELQRMKSLLLKALEQDTTLPEQERNDLLGDAEISESFLSYNNITAMSAYHKRACALLSRTTYSVDPKGAWTFSAPSILMMYHRMVGGADIENAEMKECMPYYYQVSDGHGNGSEHGFAADLFYERGQLTNADISNRMAMAAAKRKNQFSVMLTSEFLSMRMAIFNGDYGTVKKSIADCQEWLRREHQYTLLNTLDVCQAFLYALLGHPEIAPKWLLEGRLNEALIMFPATPMLQTFYNQLLLAKGEWIEVIARREECENLYGIYHNVMCDIWLHIQLAAAFAQIGRHEEALEELQAALDLSLPDGIIMPFAESEGYLTALLCTLQEQGFYSQQIDGILALSKRFHDGKQKILWAYFGEHENYGLSEREVVIARLAAMRKTNAEIAATLNLAEGTIRNQLSRIFDKLSISGSSKNKRLDLEAYLNPKNTNDR